MVTLALRQVDDLPVQRRFLMRQIMMPAEQLGVAPTRSAVLRGMAKRST
jgi:hypothetical protein